MYIYESGSHASTIDTFSMILHNANIAMDFHVLHC